MNEKARRVFTQAGQVSGSSAGRTVVFLTRPVL
jgi:hypothetical protein